MIYNSSAICNNNFDINVICNIFSDDKAISKIITTADVNLPNEGQFHLPYL